MNGRIRNWTHPAGWISLLCMLLPMAAAATAEPATASARELVISTTDALVRGLQEQQTEIRQNMELAYQLADSTVIPHVDFPRITQWVMGKHWRKASTEQRRQLISEFQDLLTRSYVTAMVSYSDQILALKDNVRYPENRSRQDERRASVVMEIDLENNQKATVQYQMYRSRGSWKIYDVSVEGISLAITYRSTFSQEISRSGVDGLIAILAARNDKAEVLLATPGATP